MSSNTLLNPRRPVLIIGMLLLSLLLIGLLGWQSYRLQQSNDATAESVLREYGILVAAEFGRRITATLGYRGYYQLISRFDGQGSADEMLLNMSKDPQIGMAATLVDGFLVFDGSRLSLANIDHSAEIEALAHKIFALSPTEESPFYSAWTDSGEHQLIYALSTLDDGSKQVYGFTVDAAGIGAMLRTAFDNGPLLPPSLADGRVSNDLLFAEVSNRAGQVLFATERRYSTKLMVSKVLGNDYQGIVDGFRIRVSIDPTSASSLVIGGLPESQLPVLAAVMVMVFGLMLTTIWLFRREHAVMRLRADFISQVSHELRTPLTQIRMFAETLLLGRTRTDDESRRSLEIIDRESRRLSHLVDNILRFSNIADATQIDRHQQALAPIIREVCDTMQVTSRDTNIQLTADGSVQANVDADALRQVLINLLDNAIKYGPRQQDIPVTVSASDSMAKISISDQGPGIPPAERERVWAAFYRLEREQDTAISGTGIGLSVVRELVEAMAGRCWIDAPNGGTRVNIELPLANDTDHE